MTPGALKKFLAYFLKGQDGFLGITVAERPTDDPKENERWSDFANIYLPCFDGKLDNPKDLNALVAANPDMEFYFTPAVLDKENRLQTSFQHSNVVWIDFDNPVDWESFDPKPSLVVQTSANKVHCYWLLTTPITTVADMRYWCKRFLNHFDGGDESGFDATQLLKMPVGKNLKLGARNEDGSFFEPHIVFENPELVYSSSDFDHMEEVTHSTVIVDTSNVPDVPKVDREWRAYLREHSVPAKFVERVTYPDFSGVEKRSGALYNMVLDLYELDYDAEKIFSILYRSPLDKFSTRDGELRGAKLLWADINRTIEKKRGKQAEIVKLKESGTAEAVTTILKDKEAKGEDKSNLLIEAIYKDLTSAGRLLQEVGGQCYLSMAEGGKSHLYEVGLSPGSTFFGLLIRRYKFLGSTHRGYMQDVAQHLLSHVQGLPPVKFHHFAHYDKTNGLVYVDRYDGSMYVLNGTTVESQPVGYNGVFFYPSTGIPLPFTYNQGYRKGGLDQLVLSGPNYIVSSDTITRPEIYTILRTWLISYFFPAQMDTRPVVLVYGEADSGKTTVFQCISQVLSGESTFAVTSIPKKSDKFDTLVTQSPYIFFDNVEINEKEMQEKLAQVATNYVAKMRKLYTTNEMVTYKARAYVGLSSRTLNNIQRDVIQRYLILPTQPVDYRNNPRKGMSEILEEVANSRDDLWSELLDSVNAMLKSLSHDTVEQPVTIRMADYGKLLAHACHMTRGSILYSRLESFLLNMQTASDKNNDVLLSGLVEYLQDLREDFIETTSSELRQDLMRFAPKVRSMTDTTLGKSLRAYASSGVLERLGVEFSTRRTKKGMLYKLEKLDNFGSDAYDEYV